MREIEAKILEVNGALLRKKLRQIGAKEIFSGRLVSIYFDFPNGRLWKERKVLRLRKENGSIALCLKRKTAKSRMKERDEFEVEVGNFSAARKILHILGFVERIRIEKTRASFKLGNAEIELDKMPGIPLFAEIEAKSDKEIIKIAGQLGFSSRQLLPWSAFDVLEHYGRHNKTYSERHKYLNK